MSKSILIIDDHPIYRDALGMLVSRQYGESNVITASSIEEGLARVHSDKSVDLILLDMEIPGEKGAQAIISLRKRFSEVEIIVISGSEERRDVEAVLRAGAKAFISKAVSTTQILKIAQDVLAGEELKARWITAAGNQELKGDSMLKLTDRQKQTLTFLCMGLSNKEISLRLGLSDITVKTHVSAIFRALGVINRTQAVIAARRLGLFDSNYVD
jgi:DNA-binding NarL/FixJ family response regulator